MHLKTVTTTINNPKLFKNKLKWTIGYKVFKKKVEYNQDEHKYVETGSFEFPHYDNGNFQLNKILKAVNTKTNGESRFIYTSSGYYIAGFHIFPIQMASKLFIRDDETRYAMFEVKYRKINAEGTHNVMTQYPVDCVVAQEMRILRRMEFPTESTKKKLRVWRNDSGKTRKEDVKK